MRMTVGLIVATLFAAAFLTACGTQAAPPPPPPAAGPCDLLSTADVAQASGKQPADTKASTTSFFDVPAADVCYWSLADGTTLVSLYRADTDPARFAAERSRSALSTAPDPGVGDESFFAVLSSLQQLTFRHGTVVVQVALDAKTPDPAVNRQRTTELARTVISHLP